ncbi:MAG: hypothetical protein KGZ41_08035 [Dethiobacter sp.]|jgi:hypothetical protein|nr:hypothetical protein [Dethiobacter sp.]MBS3898731.1 hypothetical protein [Dethiobacter sp.]MBS3983736.1 hypothetical protein [Dethiobacter sp.]MCL4463511.1 hypothetical protein [Bacillota bacterium]
MKIKDRLILGIVCGLAGNVAKMSLMSLAKKRNWAEITGPEKSAGMLLPAHRAYSPSGKIVGTVADNVVATMLGVGTVYMLTFTGKDKALLKGFAFGEATWVSFYGVLSTMGATLVGPLSPKTVLCEMVGHAVFGAAATLTATTLGDPALFRNTEQLPVSAPLQAPQLNDRST